MSAQVLVKVTGSYRNEPVDNMVFPLLKDFTVGKRGNSITVDCSEFSGHPWDKSSNGKAQIKIADKSAYEFVSGDTPIGPA